MTTMVLQAAGSFVGGLVGGPAGAAIGRGLGALAGSAIDQRLFGEGDRVIEGPRLEASQILTSHEGAVVPQAYGRVRLSGEVIWATRFEELRSSEEQGGKGPPSATVVSYAYRANFALALCEGEIGGIGRIWADGRLIENDRVVHRLHRGAEDQRPDSLIAAKQAEIGSEAPAYRGTVYIVFEGFALEDYGNRIPQIMVEVLRPTGAMSHGVRAVSIIPGASEFGYDPRPVIAFTGLLSRDTLNDHTTTARTDWSASMDQLQASCPNVERASLVVSWFGTDLRAGECAVEPRVETPKRHLAVDGAWSVAGRTRRNANLVSQIDGRAAYGGTPSDGAMVRAIADLARRGLAVTFNPFVLMDVPADNPAGQPAYPWRGRIAPVDVVADCAAFETAYRGMVLHYARLCAGTAVDLFVLGSELRGLTQARAPDGTYPFVAALRRLAADARAILGPGVRLTYGADWSEYASHRGGADVRFPLDDLWADANIDLVGIDNYLPLTDWREDGPHLDGERSPLDPRALAAGIEGGEYFDWYYASAADRAAGRRLPITDGMGEPWVYRAKDIRSWWENPHHERVGGVRSATPSPWRPRSKPVAFLELGCPAVRAGANQPNVFVDAKSSESFLPHGSDGGRDDEMQAAFLEAHFAHWAGSDMVDAALTHVWAWDARPWPAFPERLDVWSDGVNWARGHWLNGRAGSPRIRDLLAALLERGGVGQFDVTDVEGWAMGYVVGTAASPRAAIEGVLDLYRIDVFEHEGRLVFRSRGRDEPVSIPAGDYVDEVDRPLVSRMRAQETDLPRAAVLEYIDPAKGFQPGAAGSRRLAGGSRRDATLSLPITLEGASANALVEGWLHQRWAGRETLNLRLPPDYAHLTPGAAVVLPDMTGARVWRVVSIDEAFALDVTLASTEPEARVVDRSTQVASSLGAVVTTGATHAIVLDLPLLAQPAGETGTRIAVASEPWPGPFDVSRMAASEATNRLVTVEERATIGRLTRDLAPGPLWVFDETNAIEVELHCGALSSAPALDVLGGANAAALRVGDGWEVVQFRDARLIGPMRYRLTGLLRGQAGTEGLGTVGEGADFVRLDAAVVPLDLPDGAAELNLLVAPRRRPDEGTGITVEPGMRDLLPYRPVHLRARTAGSGFRLGWTRRDRGLADGWALFDVPMSEAREAYRVEHLRAGTLVAEVETERPEIELSGALAGDVVRVAQLSALVGPGPYASIRLP